MKKFGIDVCLKQNQLETSNFNKSKLSLCVTKGHLLSRTAGLTRIFGDYSLKNEQTGEIEEIGITTIIPNSVITKIQKLK